MSLYRWPLRAAFGLYFYGLVASAGAIEPLAVEKLEGESIWEAAFAYERACWRLGLDRISAVPAREVTLGFGHFVLLDLGDEYRGLPCFNALDPGRRAIDGNVRWPDGMSAGALLPGQRPVADAEWLDAAQAILPPPFDHSLSDALLRGTGEAFTKAGTLSPGEALGLVAALTSERDARVLTALERLSRTHPHWRVRRAAAEYLDPELSFASTRALALEDPAWEVRQVAVSLVGAASSAPLATRSPHEKEALLVLDSVLSKDTAAEVRRQAVWALSSQGVQALSDTLKKLLKSDEDPQVRAATLEALAGAQVLSRPEIRPLLDDPSELVKAVAVHLLAVNFDEKDAARLWLEMRAPSRSVRLAALPMLGRIEVTGLGEALWALYLREALESDPQMDALAQLSDALARSGWEPLPVFVGMRLEEVFVPEERRLLSGLLSRISPDMALERLLPALESQDPLLRAIAAEMLPDTPDTRSRRRSMLRDSSPLVRAAAVLGLCSVVGFALTPEEERSLDLHPSGLGREAALRLPSCGRAERPPPRVRVALEGIEREAAGGELPRGAGVAAIALLLLIVSVVGIRLGARR